MIYKGIYRQQKLTNTIKIRLKIKKYDGEGMTDNLEKLDKNKLIIVACPHADRSNMARTYLTSIGYKCRYLTGGLIGLTERLKGGKAKDIKL